MSLVTDPTLGTGMSSPTFTVTKLIDFGNMTKFLLNAARGGFEHCIDVWEKWGHSECRNTQQEKKGPTAHNHK